MPFPLPFRRLAHARRAIPPHGRSLHGQEAALLSEIEDARLRADALAALRAQMGDVSNGDAVERSPVEAEDAASGAQDSALPADAARARTPPPAAQLDGAKAARLERQSARLAVELERLEVCAARSWLSRCSERCAGRARLERATARGIRASRGRARAQRRARLSTCHKSRQSSRAPVPPSFNARHAAASARLQADIAKTRERLALAQSGLRQVDEALAAARQGGLRALAQLATSRAPDCPVSPSFQAYLRGVLQLRPAAGRK